MLAEEGQEDVAVVEVGGFGSKVNIAELISRSTSPAAVDPRADDERVGRPGIHFGDGVEDATRADEIFGVEPTADRHHSGMNIVEAGGDVASFPKVVVV